MMKTNEHPLPGNNRNNTWGKEETTNNTQDNKFVYVVKNPPLLSRNKPPGEGVQWWGMSNMYMCQNAPSGDS
jgi:hypothetical protein